MHQKDARGVPANTVAVARIRCDLSGRSDAGVIVVSREGARPGDFNRAYGADRNLRAGANWTANVFWAATTGPDLRGGNDQKRLSSRWDNGFAVDALVQCNTETRRVFTTARMNFTYRPLSDFAIVFNENRLTDAPFPLQPPARALMLKFTRLLQF